MQEWESKTPVQFIQRTNQSQYVKIGTLATTDAADGYSTVGNVKNAKIQLKESARISTCLHELGHTIGLVHEHERDDRFDHIVIHQDEVVADFLYALNPKHSMISLHPFDFRSIMIYHSYAFAKDSNRPTITTVNGNTYSNVGTISIYDAEIVRYYYNDMTYNSILQVKGNIRNSADYTIVYPQSVKLGDNVIITVKAKVKTGSPQQIKTFNFYNPVNGYLVSSNNNVVSGNSNIRIQEFVFKANSRGQLKIYTNEMINLVDHIIINVI
jgi:hypothetical protein